MRGSKRVSSIAASPVLVGAVTTLIAVIAVFLAYNANSGLPFVPTYNVSVDLPNAARLVPNNEVRIGGSRVGVINTIDTVRLADGSAGARLNLKLDKKIEPLPNDTAAQVRYKSSFGLKYLDLQRGKARPPTGRVEDLPEGGVLPVGNAITQVEFDDVYNTFDSETRFNSRSALEGYGDALAGRGQSLNEAIQALNPLFTHLRPVMQTLSNPRTRLPRLIKELADTARVLRPVASQQAELFAKMADVFDALSADPAALQATIEKAPGTLAVGTQSLKVVRPFVANLTDLSRDLKPAVHDLRPTLPALNRALKVGTPVLRRLPPTNRELGRVFDELNRLVEQPATKSALVRLTDGLSIAKPLIHHVAPYQTVCNQINGDFNFLANHLSEEDDAGFAQRQYLITGPPQDSQQNPFNDYAGLPSNGKNKAGVFQPRDLPILHGHLYGPAVDSHGNADCQTGQTGYALGQQLSPGQNKNIPANGVRNLTGNRGPGYFSNVTKRP